MDERGGHDDLRSLSHRSIISYVHRRTELYCSSLPYLSLSFRPPCEEVSTRSFYSSSGVVIMRPGARQVAPRWLKSYTTSRALMVRST
jgi:hypothetical protein